MLICAPVCAAILFMGCGQARWDSFPVAVYSDSSMVPNSQAQADLNDAMSFWEAKAGKKLFNYQGQWNGQNPPYTGAPDNPDSMAGNVMFSPNPWPFAADIVGQTTRDASMGKIKSAIVMINPNIQYCTGDCAGETNLISRRNAMAHELGHFLGFDHIQDPNNIMYPTVLPGGSMDSIAVDQNTLEALTN